MKIEIEPFKEGDTYRHVFPNLSHTSIQLPLTLNDKEYIFTSAYYLHLAEKDPTYILGVKDKLIKKALKFIQGKLVEELI